MARKGTMFDKEIESVFLKEKMIVKIYEPEQYNPIYETNICIMQDGDDYFQLGRIATLSDELHDEYEIVNTYFVGIHYIDRYDRLKKYHPDGEQNEAYMKFLTEEVVPLIDETIPLNPLGVKRTLMGDSLAATLALMTALKFPSLFHKVILQSPFVDDTVIQVAQNSDNHLLEIYHSIGLLEESVPTTELGKVDFVIPNQDLQKVLSKSFSNYIYKEIDEGNHTWKYWQQELPEVLMKMFS